MARTSKAGFWGKIPHPSGGYAFLKRNSLCQYESSESDSKEIKEKDQNLGEDRGCQIPYSSALQPFLLTVPSRHWDSWMAP